jgi:hypothetical protein
VIALRRDRAKALAIIAALLSATVPAAAQDAGMRGAKGRASGHEHVSPRRLPPIPIPQSFSPPQETYASFPQPAAAPPNATAPSECQLRLAKIALFKPLPVLVGPGECGAIDAVLLRSVMLPDDAKVAVTPPATLRCAMAEEVARWLRDDVAPAALKLGAALRGLENYDSYECRGRNRVRGATLSEHGRANALDVRALRLADGAMIALTDANVAKDWREGLRASACARFSTVLGPGSDGNHEEHIHLDLAERHAGYKMCEWDVREPVVQAKKTEPETEKAGIAPEAEKATIAGPVPLPRPRPALAVAQTKPRLRKSRWWWR